MIVINTLGSVSVSVPPDENNVVFHSSSVLPEFFRPPLLGDSLETWTDEIIPGIVKVILVDFQYPTMSDLLVVVGLETLSFPIATASKDIGRLMAKLNLSPDQLIIKSKVPRRMLALMEEKL